MSGLVSFVSCPGLSVGGAVVMNFCLVLPPVLLALRGCLCGCRYTWSSRSLGVLLAGSRCPGRTSCTRGRARSERRRSSHTSTVLQGKRRRRGKSRQRRNESSKKKKKEEIPKYKGPGRLRKLVGTCEQAESIRSHTTQTAWYADTHGPFLTQWTL